MNDSESPLTADKAARILDHHFRDVDEEQFSALAEPCLSTSIDKEKSLMNEQENKGQLTLPVAHPCPTQLDAYLACALTGLDHDQRSLVFQLSDTVSQVCAGVGIDLYEPRKNTDPVHHADVEDSDVFKLDREKVLQSDLLIHLSHYPSTGSGEELDFAYSALLPMIVISRSDDRVSRMITGIPSFSVHIKYTEPEELRYSLEACLLRMRPILQERKAAFAEHDRNIVGDRIRTIRQSLGLTREDVFKAVPHLTVETLEQLEDQTDRVANPTLLQLRELATVLKTTVAELVEPNLSHSIVMELSDWLEGRQAARRGVSPDDRKRIMRLFLKRMMDELE